jgi:hypothetical protein
MIGSYDNLRGQREKETRGVCIEIRLSTRMHVGDLLECSTVCACHVSAAGEVTSDLPVASRPMMITVSSSPKSWLELVSVLDGRDCRRRRPPRG